LFIYSITLFIPYSCVCATETERRKNVASKTAEGEEGEEDDKYDDNDLSEDMWRLRKMQKQELNKV